MSRRYVRLEGLDLARGLAVIGMVFVNFMYVFSHDHVARIAADESILSQYTATDLTTAAVVFLGFAGRAVGVFLVLFGIGLSLQAKRYAGREDTVWPRPQIIRYTLLILVGAALLPVWDADILHFIGIYGLLCIPLARLRTRWLVVTAVVVLAAAELARVALDYSTGWAAGQVGSHYSDMWTVTGQARQILFNGYHPVLPWLAMPIYGMILGRLDLSDRSTLISLTWLGALGAVVGFSLQAAGVPAEFFPADTLFVWLGVTNATWIIAISCVVARQRIESHQNGVFRSMGRLAFSHYPGHVLLGIIPIMVLRHEATDMSFTTSFSAATIYLVITGWIGLKWLSTNGQGPLERALRSAVRRLSRQDRPGRESRTSQAPTA